MLSVPLAVSGALLSLWLTGNSLNIYSQIGIILLIGLMAKNGILIVEFANQLRDEGRSIRDAVIEASALRLRPIVMTVVATMLGAVPLVLASGAGAESRGRDRHRDRSAASASPRCSPCSSRRCCTICSPASPVRSTRWSRSSSGRSPPAACRPSSPARPRPGRANTPPG